MRLTRSIPVCFSAGLVLLVAGCSFVSSGAFEAAQSQNRVLGEQNRAQLAEIENLKTHALHVEDQLASTEEKLASLEEQLGLDRKQLVNYQSERVELHEQIKGLAQQRLPVTPEVHRRLAALAQRFPALRYDPQSGVARLETDILFDTGRTELKPGATQVLSELVQALKSPDGRDLKVLVVGHTDDRPIARKPARDAYASNFELSTARAQNVADLLRKSGLEEQRLGVAGFSAHEPVTPNVTARDRQQNRRVEIFVMAPEVPVVGWTDSTPKLY
jgi:chemotaxis protein MotB